MNQKYVATLALAAVLILVIGWLIRPREIPAASTPLPTETELARLARLSQRRSLENMTAYFGSLAGDVAGSVLRVPDLGVSGLVWGQRLLVVPRLNPRFPDRVTVGGPSGDVRGDTSAWGRGGARQEARPRPHAGADVGLGTHHLEP